MANTVLFYHRLAQFPPTGRRKKLTERWLNEKGMCHVPQLVIKLKLPCVLNTVCSAYTFHINTYIFVYVTCELSI